MDSPEYKIWYMFDLFLLIDPYRNSDKNQKFFRRLFLLLQVIRYRSRIVSVILKSVIHPVWFPVL